MRLPALLAILLVAGCSQSTAAPSTSPEAAVRLSAGGQFAAKGTTAIVYDGKLAPDGSQASATVESSPGRTVSSLVVEGLLAKRTYGAHLHVNPCGAKPDDAGPHFQHQQGHADAANEVWLDVRTDEAGMGRATAAHEWGFPAGRVPGSIVIHAQPTKADGTAGSRVACLTLKR